MTDRLSTTIAQAVLVTLTLVLLVTGCQSGGSHRVASRTSRALLPESFGRAVSGKQSLVEQTQRPDPVIEQASATEFAEGTQEIRRPAGESAVGRAAEIDFPVTEQAELFDLPEMQPKVQSISAITDANISAASLEERPQLELSAAESSAAESSLSFQNAIATSLAQNPDLITARGQDQVSAAAVDVAATYQWNPFVQAQILPADGRGGQTNYYMWLMQRFELAHQLSFREQGANATLNQVRWTIHQTELLNISQTARLYFTALYQQELHELANQTAVLNEDLLGVVERRFAAGVGTAAQVTTAKVAARQSRNQSHLADATYQAALLAIRQQLDLPASEPLKLADRLPAFSWRPANAFCNGVLASAETTGAGSQELANELVNGRPDVMAALAGANAASANYRLANAARTPDVQAGPIFAQNPNGSQELGVRLQMDLPIWNTGDPLARQRTAEWQQLNRVYSQLKIRAAREAETAIDRYERARLLAIETKVDLSPFSERMPADLKDINAQFQAGQADVLTVYATQNSLLQDRRTYLDLLNELAQSAAAVVQATALPVDRIVTLGDGENSL